MVNQAQQAHHFRSIPVFREHWIYNEFFGLFRVDGSKEYKGDGLSILKTTYRDNRFLTEDDIKALEE